MHAQHWHRMKAIFAAALDREPHEREECVTAACGDDLELREKVNALLRAHAVEDGFIEQPAADHLGLLAEYPAQRWIGQRLGPWRLVAEAGRGGMSQVFKAVREPEEFEQQVAIKLLRPALGTQSLLRRFRAERQLLAKLNHPHIAHFLDGGSASDGTPYLVMEYVEGVPIDEYCETHALGLEQRLDLFRTLCGAVHYVHQHLMVHGDLKGSNVLVTREGVVKLLDFGIAKLLQSATPPGDATRANTLLLLTPEYASPEQVRGESITTASDVYSLGALLYRLVTGRTPFASAAASPLKLAEEIERRDPTLPSVTASNDRGNYSQFARALHGDLDNIILKALKKSPHERYESAAELAADVQRYLRGFPVEARPDSVWYRTRKFVARHRAASIAVVGFAIALVAGIASTAWQAHVARTERARAERHFNDVRELSAVFLADVYDAVTQIPGSTEARKLLVDHSLEYLSALQREVQDSPELDRDLAKAYELLGDVQGATLNPNLGEREQALDNYRRALEIRRSLATEHPTVEARGELLRSHIMLSEALLSSGKTSEAEDVLEQGVRLADALLAEPNLAPVERRYAAAAYMTHGWMQWTSGAAPDALVSLQRARTLYRELAAQHPQDPQARRDLAVIAGRIGEAHHHGTGRLDEAVSAYRETLDMLLPLAAEHPLAAEPKRMAAYTRATLGELYNALGEPRSALRELEPAVATLEELRVADASDQMAPLALAAALNFRGESALQVSDLDLSLRSFAEAERLTQPSAPTSPELQLVRATALAGLAMTHAAQAQSGAGVHIATQRAAARDWSQRALASLAPLADQPQAGKAAQQLIQRVNAALASVQRGE